MRPLLTLALLVIAVKAQAQQELGSLVAKTKLPSGLVLVVGEGQLGEGRALAQSGRFLVQVLVESNRVDACRDEALKAGIHGRLVFDALPKGGELPHPDRFVDLVIADLATSPVKPDELQRVLNVDGWAMLRREGTWSASQRAAEAGIDAWTHPWHGIDGQVLSRDEKVGLPTAIQWVAGPGLADGSTPGKHAVIGRGAFAAVDNVGSQVQVRSAGSGLPRWRGAQAVEVRSELVLDGDHLLCRPSESKAGRNVGEFGPLTAFDIVDGKEIRRYEDAPALPMMKKKAGFPSSLATGKHLVVVADAELAVLERDGGKRVWTKTLDSGAWFAPVVLDGKVIVAESSPERTPVRARIDNAGAIAISAFALETGAKLWRTPIKETGANLLPLIAAEGMVFLHTSSYQARQPDAYVAALDAATGRELWRHPLPEGETKNRWTATDSASRIICRDGKLHYVGGHMSAAMVVFDARSGKMLGEPRKRPATVGYGGECSASLATPNWLIMSCVTWWDRDYQPHNIPAFRSSCGTGVFPAQGMVYVNPNGCDCTSYVRGYAGMSCTPLGKAIADEDRLVRGEPYSPPKMYKWDGWRTFLGNASRTSATSDSLPTPLKELWRTPLVQRHPAGPLSDDQTRDEYWSGPLTAPVAANQRVFVGLADHQGLSALDANTGTKLWEIALSGVIESPPTLHMGLCLFGTQDGQVHAVHADSGKLAWRFQAAPSLRPAMLHGRLASAFPVPSSPLILGDRLLVSAGYHSNLGGIDFWALDPLTGKILSKSRLSGPSGRSQDQMVLNDILCAAEDGKSAGIFRHFRVDADVQHLPAPKVRPPLNVPEALPVSLDRKAALVRFPHDQRGGSTHGWSSKMVAGNTRAFRVVLDEGMVWGLEDPTDGAKYPQAGPVLVCRKAGVPLNSAIEWGRTARELGLPGSLTAMVKAGPHLVLGGGARDGSSGVLTVVRASDGEVLQQLQLPAQVMPCGLAVADGRLIATCVNGEVYAFGK